MQIYKLFYNYNFLEVIKISAESTIDDNTLYYSSISSVPELVNRFVTHKTNIRVACLSETEALAFFEAVKQCFIFQKAAGGIVCTPHSILAIERLGKWDLPKGHVEPGETDPQAAIREVQEETGLQQLKITADAGFTYHIFQQFNSTELVLKQTHWYTMQNMADTPLKPQTEENITQVVWMNKKDVKIIINNTYSSISLLLEQCFNRHLL